MAAPLISVIIPCYNAAPWIGDALESVRRQAVTSVEVIVVDDGSTDDSAALVRSRFPEARLLFTPHQGPGAARNAGTKMATGDFIQYLDADDCLADGKWHAQLDALQSQDADVAYGDWQKCNEAGTPLTGADALLARRLGARPELDLVSCFWCPPAVYLHRRRSVEAAALWNEALPLNEDVRFLLDRALVGAKFVYVPGVAAFYRIHAGLTLTRDPETFLRCCLANDTMLEKFCVKRGTLDAPARDVLLKNYLEIARNSCVRFPAIFEEACAALERLAPGFIPARPRLLSWTSRLLGYRRAEALAFNYRRLKLR